MNPRNKLILLFALFLFCDAVILFAIFGRPVWQPIMTKLTGGRTVEQALERYGPDADARLYPRFEAAGMQCPPEVITLIGLKEEKQLELWAREEESDWVLVHTYPILAASGNAGPKLREGDKQVPEGIYRIEGLNPNSSYHLSMKLNYPNPWDLQRAQEDGRDQPGTNIFIHGKAASIGCLAMGDPAIEELFSLVDRVGIENVRVILMPHDPDTRPLVANENMPKWTSELYQQLTNEAALIRSSHSSQ